MNEKEIEKIKEKIFEDAKNILENNRVKLNGESYTKPAPELYPFQWNWDSGFIAYGYSHYDIEKAVGELRSLFKGQWGNGFLPHIIFHTKSDGYFPNYDFWNTSEISKHAPKDVHTSGITQPPLHAVIVWHIYEVLKKTDEEKAKKLLAELYPKLIKLHEYFYTKRDPEKSGMITIYHPWESGFDNSPRWDTSLNAVEVKDLPEYERLDTKIVDSKFRPTDAEYDKYVYLANELKKKNYDDNLIYKDHPFKVKDKVFSSILCLANKKLELMAEVLKEDDSEIREWTRRFEKSLMEVMWCEEDKLFYDFDVVAQKQIKMRTIASLMPIITGLLSESQINEMTIHLDKVNFCGDKSCTLGLLPSAGFHEHEFNHEQYWRGPIWVNINWFLYKGFLINGMKDRAESLRIHILRLIEEEGFWEYYSPINAQGLGSENFSWTAALAIDLLYE